MAKLGDQWEAFQRDPRSESDQLHDRETKKDNGIMNDQITNEDSTDLLVSRLNELISDPGICKDISALFQVKVPVSEATYNHPTIQVSSVRTWDFLDCSMDWLDP